MKVIFYLAWRLSFCFLQKFKFRLFPAVSIPFGIFALSACPYQDGQRGRLRVDAPVAGKFEIYKVAAESPLQLVSEQIGSFNEDMTLSVGSYLVLADCSSQLVVVKSQRLSRIAARTIRFTLAQKPRPEDQFIVQCTQNAQINRRQKLQNQFEMTLIDDSTELLVGLTPFSMKERIAQNSNDSNAILEFPLASLRIQPSLERKAEDDVYFVSTVKQRNAVTIEQELGRWVHLLPGDYLVELNGTMLDVSVAAGEEKTVDTGSLLVKADPRLWIQKSSQDLDRNFAFVEINGERWLSLNESYAVLPGKSRIRLAGSERWHDVEIAPGVEAIKTARSVTVILGCPYWDWDCLGSRKIFLFNKGQTYPFAKGISDTPLLFFEEDAWLTVEGSRDIRRLLGKTHEDIEVGVLRVKPQPELKAGLVTDLLRIESAGGGFEGNTVDLPLDGAIDVYLPRGYYHLAKYNSLTSIDGERRKSVQGIQIKANDLIEVDLPVYLSEKKLRSLALEQEQRRERRLKSRTQRAPMRWLPSETTQIW